MWNLYEITFPVEFLVQFMIYNIMMDVTLADL